eukprot:22702-Pyramimonas_sp.AAC.1
MQRMSGEVADEAALRERFTLPVFTISSVDFQKLTGARPHDGPPNGALPGYPSRPPPGCSQRW